MFKEIVARKTCIGLLELQRRVICYEIFLVHALSLETLPDSPPCRLRMGIKRWLNLLLPRQTNQKESFLKTRIPLGSQKNAFTLSSVTHLSEDS